MKMKFILFAAIFGLTSCATPPVPAPTASAAPTKVSQKRDISFEASKQRPFIGMTKAQALACYGTPKTRTLTDEGERWGYFGYSRNLSEVPFKPRFLRTGTLFFGPDGKVKQFSWDFD